MKYIVIESGGEELIFVFPRVVSHDMMLESVRKTRDYPGAHWSRPYVLAPCVGAGFVDDGRCHGRSESLNIASRGEADTALLNK